MCYWLRDLELEHYSLVFARNLVVDFVESLVSICFLPAQDLSDIRMLIAIITIDNSQWPYYQSPDRFRCNARKDEGVGSQTIWFCDLTVPYPQAAVREMKEVQFYYSASASLLQELVVEKYYKVFAKHKISIDVLPLLNEANLLEVKIPSHHHNWYLYDENHIFRWALLIPKTEKPFWMLWRISRKNSLWVSLVVVCIYFYCWLNHFVCKPWGYFHQANRTCIV